MNVPWGKNLVLKNVGSSVKLRSVDVNPNDSCKSGTKLRGDRIQCSPSASRPFRLRLWPQGGGHCVLRWDGFSVLLVLQAIEKYTKWKSNGYCGDITITQCRNTRHGESRFTLGVEWIRRWWRWLWWWWGLQERGEGRDERIVDVCDCFGERRTLVTVTRATDKLTIDPRSYRRSPNGHSFSPTYWT